MGIAFDPSLMVKYLPLLFQASLITIQLTVLAVFFGTIIGLLSALGKMSQNLTLRWFFISYIEFIRGTPLLVQLYLGYFGVGGLLGQSLNMFWTAVIVCSINSGAYIAEIFRAGIQSIDKGQSEAARSLGMSQFKSFRYIILPQAFKRVIPPLGNEFITMLKDTSLVALIGMTELFRQGQLIVARNYAAFEIYLTVALIYFVLTLPISRWVVYMERKMSTGDKH